MVFDVVPAHRSSLTLQQVLDLCNIYLDNASRTEDRSVALVLCHDAEIALNQAKKASKKHPSPNDVEHQALRDKVATAYTKLGKLMDDHELQDKAKIFYKKTEKWG